MRRIPPLLFLCTLVVTVVIFSSDGIAGNHLIDLQVASAVLVVDWAFQVGVPDFAIGASAAACLIVWLGLMVNYGSTDTVPVRAQLKDVIHVIGRTDQTILSEHPLVPIVAGQQPYVIDPFSFRLMLEKRPSLGEPPCVSKLERTGDGGRRYAFLVKALCWLPPVEVDISKSTGCSPSP